MYFHSCLTLESWLFIMKCSAHLRDVLLNLLKMEGWPIFLPIFDRYLNIVLYLYSYFLPFNAIITVTYNGSEFGVLVLHTLIILHQSSESGWHARSSQATSQHSVRLPQYPLLHSGTHLYSWVERNTVRVKCPAYPWSRTRHIDLARAQIWTAYSRV